MLAAVWPPLPLEDFLVDRASFVSQIYLASFDGSVGCGFSLDEAQSRAAVSGPAADVAETCRHRARWMPTARAYAFTPLPSSRATVKKVVTNESGIGPRKLASGLSADKRDWMSSYRFALVAAGRRTRPPSQRR